MRGAIAIVRREILERRQLVYAAAIAGLVPFAIPLARGLRGADAADARRWTALIIAAAFAAGASVALGLTTIAGDMAHRRIGFYWTRPVPGWAIWAGKLTGAWLLAILAAGLALAPTLAVDGLPTLAVDFSPHAPELLALGSLAVVLLCHALAILVRSRTLLLVLDLAALAVALLALRAIVLVLARLAAGYAAVDVIHAAEAVLAFGIVVGGAAAVSSGRTDLRRAHIALSRVLWGWVAVGLIGLAGYAWWVASATPRDLSAIAEVTPGRAGDWVTIVGEARMATATFAFNVKDGRSVRVPSLWRPVQFADHRAAWLTLEGRDTLSIASWNLDRPGARPVTAVRLAEYPAHLYLSPDGTRLASYDRYDDILSVHDLDSGRLLASARVAGSLGAGDAVFLSNDLIRVFAAQQTGADVLRLDIASRRLVRVAHVSSGGPLVGLWVAPGGERFVLAGAERLTIHDADTGRESGTLLEEHDAAKASFSFLSNGRIAVSTGAGRLIRIVTADGQIERTIELPVGAWTILGEPRDGYLTLQLQKPDTIGVLDLAAGRLREVSGLHPAVESVWIPRWNPGRSGVGASLFVKGTKTLVLLDPVTLEEKVVLGDGSPRP